MKLSKRFAAAIIAICMLLMSMPAFAATISEPNASLKLTSDPVSLHWTSNGNSNSCVAFVVAKGEEEKLGINIDDLASRITVAGTAFDGIVLDGALTINRPHYHVDKSTEAAKVMAYDEITHLQFKGAVVKSIRQSGGKLVFEVDAQELLDKRVPGTVKKVKAEALTRDPDEAGVIELADEDFVTLTTEQEQALVGNKSRGEVGQYDLTPSGAAGYDVVLAARAGEDYEAEITFDTGAFPAGTIFVATSKMNLNGATTKSDWGYTVANSTTAPEGTYVAQESGEYAVYALKTGYNSDSTRNSGAIINDVSFSFTQANMPAELSNKSGYYWQKDVNGNTVTLNKGQLILVNLRSDKAYSRTAALALVPVSGTAALDAAPVKWSSVESYPKDKLVSQADLEWLHKMTAINYVAPPAITRTINVNGTDYEVSSDDAGEGVAAVDFDNVPIAGVTVMDALVKAGVINAENRADYQNKLTIKLNGNQIYSPDKFIISTGDLVTTTNISTVDATTFLPTVFTELYTTLGAGDSGIKMCFVKKNLPSSNIYFAYDGTEILKDTLTNAKVVGFVEVNNTAKDAPTDNSIKKDYTAGELAGKTFYIPKGSRLYFLDEYFTGNVQIKEGTTSGFTMRGSISMTNSSDKHLHVVLPDGTIGHHPYHIQQSGYEWNNVYLLNSQTTNTVKARYVETTGKWQISTDGGNYIYILKYTVDGDGNFVSAVSAAPEYLLFNKPISVELKANERAVVWGYTPYENATTGGTSMVPVTGVLANPAN